MDEEIKAAVDWWAEAISENRTQQDNGDAFQSAALSMLRIRARVPDDEAIQAFKIELAKAIASRINPESWDLENPLRGSALRTVSTDYGPEECLRWAAESAGIDLDLFPIKTVMWINPGSVSVSRGYAAPVEEIFKSCA